MGGDTNEQHLGGCLCCMKTALLTPMDSGGRALGASHRSAQAMQERDHPWPRANQRPLIRQLSTR